MSRLKTFWSSLTGTRFPKRQARRVRPSVLHLERRDAPAGMQVGMNVERVVDYNPDWMFTDEFLESRPWTSYTINTATGMSTQSGTPHVDAKGWPTMLDQSTNALGQLMQQRLSATMNVNMDGHYPAGLYHAQWKGTGTISWLRDVQSVTQTVDPDGTHHAVINVVPTRQGIELRIDSMSTSDPIHDIHLWVPDYQGQSFVGQVWHPGASFSPFHPLYMERMAPFNTIRFMHAQDAVTSDMVHWSDRLPYDYATQGTSATVFQNGIATEYMIEMANELHANPWFCMPHLGDDDFVRGFAQQVHDTLAPNRTIYVELSDELWNPSFGYEGAAWLRDQSAATGRNVYDIWADELKRDFAIWSQVFADTPSRLVRVVAGQAANSWVASQVLMRMDGQFDAVSCDGYVTFAQPQLAQFSATTTADQVIDALYSQALPNTMTFLQNHKNLADQYSRSLGRPIQFVTYEGGPLLGGTGQPYAQAFLDAARSPRMYDLYRQLLVGADRIGVNLFTAYVYTDCSPYGDASTLRYQDQPISEAHRYRALYDATQGAFFSLTPAPTLPNVVVTGALTQVTEGTPVTMSASLAQQTTTSVTYAWTASLAGRVIAQGSGPRFTVTPPDNGTVSVTCIATGANGATSQTTTSFLAVNAPPQSLAIVGPTSVTTGTPVTLSINFFDPGSSDTFRFRWTIIDNRGATLASGATSTLTFTPPAAGGYYITWEVTDDDGGRAVVSRSLMALAPPLPAPLPRP